MLTERCVVDRAGRTDATAGYQRGPDRCVLPVARGGGDDATWVVRRDEAGTSSDDHRVAGCWRRSARPRSAHWCRQLLQPPHPRRRSTQ